MSRRELREHIFILLFRVEFNSLEEMPEQTALYFENMEQPASEADEEYIQKKFRNILEKLSEIDKAVNEKAEKWNTSRMGKVELTLIRLAVYEMRYDETVPVRVAINEAVELAKKYGQDESGSFVNGILAKMIEE